MVYLGAALMIYNIWQYARFARRIRGWGDWKRERLLLNIPLALLVLFLIGYLTVGLFGRPDAVVSAILFGGSVYVAVMALLIQRIADRIRENEQLEARAVAAEGASVAKSTFLSNISHDIRTPLNAIIGYTNLAKGASPEQQRAYIDKIGVAGRQLLTLVNEVLEMSRIESGRLELTPEDADLEAVVRGAGDMIHTQLEEKGIAFEVTCQVEDRWVRCDAHRLSRVLMNMLGNAAKFTEKGGTVRLSLRQLGKEGDGGRYEIRVSDDGIGMSPEFAQRIFTPFERERTATVSRTQGTGLGMAITKSIVDAMGGTIDLDTAPGRGTTFTLTFAFPAGEAPREEAHSAAEREGFEGRRLLLAEDNDVNREIAVMLLTQAGFSVDTVEDGAQAVERVAAARPGDYDAVLMDIQMPVMDGYTAARRIRALPDRRLAGIPIVAMTANALSEDVQAAGEAGMQGHIAKPLDVNQMLATLAEVLAGDRETP